MVRLQAFLCDNWDHPQPAHQYTYPSLWSVDMLLFCLVRLEIRRSFAAFEGIPHAKRSDGFVAPMDRNSRIRCSVGNLRSKHLRRLRRRRGLPNYPFSEAAWAEIEARTVLGLGTPCAVLRSGCRKRPWRVLLLVSPLYPSLPRSPLSFFNSRWLRSMFLRHGLCCLQARAV